MASSGAIEADICVIGGGPAGTTFAAQMARLGYTVALIERRAIPRAVVGQSLTAGAAKLLAAIGAAGVLAVADAVPIEQVEVRWDGATVSKLQAGQPHSATVDRGRLDALLLELARDAGVRVVQPAIARAPLRADLGWRIPLSAGAAIDAVEARFVADASGRRSLLAGRRIASSARTLALAQIWSADRCPDAMIVEAIADGWLWGAPLSGGAFATVAFIDADLPRRRGVRRAQLERLNRALIARTELFAGLLQASPSTPISACSATSYASTEPIDRAMIKLGDAALAIDPISSAGVEQAIQTALSGAAAAHTLLDGGDGELALAFYRDSIRDSAARHAAWASRLYADSQLYADAPFWRRRRAPAQQPGPRERAAMQAPTATRTPRSFSFAELADRPLRLTPAARLAPTPAIVGDRVERRPALTAPRLERPVAFLQGREIASLLRFIDGRTAADVVRAWSCSMRHETALAIVAWLWRAEVLEA